MPKKWKIAPKVTEEFASQYPTLGGVVLQLLYNRGISSQEKIDEFMNPDYGQDIHDPFLFRDMEKAVDRIFRAVEEKEKVAVFGDYDADGMTSSALMFTTLETLGAKDAQVYIPNRETEGYGMNPAAVRELAEDGVKLIVTVDCGTSDRDEVDLARELGMDVIVTDHHQEPEELPQPLALINPKLKEETYPFSPLAGVGVAFKLAQALIARKSEESQDTDINWEGFEKWLLDLVAVGTVADRMPLLGENRTLVRYGLVVLNKTRRPGLRALANNANLQIGSLDARNIGFQIAPRLNAAGRLNHTSAAYRLLIAEDGKEAEELALSLEKTNQERQRIVEKIVDQARVQVAESARRKEFLFAVNYEKDAWPSGVLGLVAAKISEEFNRPAIVMSNCKRGLVGSGRIPDWEEEFDLVENLHEFSEHLAEYGGHAGACGLTAKDPESLAAFRKKTIERTASKLEAMDLSSFFLIDAEVRLVEVDWGLHRDLEGFEPFGEKNDRPRLMVRGVSVLAADTVGQTGKHLRLTVTDNPDGLPAGGQAKGTVRKMIAFGFGENWGKKLKKGDKIDAVFELGVNEWNGNRELQLKVIDLREGFSR